MVLVALAKGGLEDAPGTDRPTDHPALVGGRTREPASDGAVV